jgi:hypothetical protein
MQYVVRVRVFDTIHSDIDKAVRPGIGASLQRMAESGMLRAGGIMPSDRGGVFIFETDDIEKLYDVIGPEIYSIASVEVQPLMPLEHVGALFEKWAQEGR